MDTLSRKQKLIPLFIIGGLILTLLAALTISIIFIRKPRLPLSNAMATSGMAQRYYEDNNLDAALELNQLAAAHRKSDWLSEMRTGNVYFKKENYNEAAQYYRHAVELAPDIPLPRNNLAVTLHKLGKTDEAIRVYQSIIDEFGAYDSASAAKASAALELIKQSH